MSSAYVVRTGDTFESIARRFYGTPDRSSTVARANPGVREPLAVGTTLVIPGVRPESGGTTPAADVDEVAILIDGERFRFWESASIRRSMDSPDTMTLSAPFEVDEEAFRRIFRPFSYRALEILVGGERLFTGTMVGVTPRVQGEAIDADVLGYSIPGVLGDCTAPASAWPLEFDFLDLREVAEAVIEPFGVTLDLRGEPGAVFERVAASPGQSILSFLTPLAQQRNFVIGSTPEGALLIWRSVATGAPVARLRQGESPLVSVTPAFSPQDYYSHVTGMELVFLGWPGAQHTAPNPRLEGVIRPHTFEVGDTLSADVVAAVDAKLGRMFANACGYTVQVSTWRDPAGRLWAPNTTLTLEAPSAMVYTEYELLIRSVEFDRAARSQTATLELVLPGSFEGQSPASMPWD